jgi:two-component system, NarL family, response regulator LiaR
MMENRTEKIRVIIADDHEVVREGTRALLEREPDIEVVGEASDGEETVRLIESQKPDVAVLDISMPKLNGIEVTRLIKPVNPSVAVLILTVYDNDEYVFAMLEAGAAGYLLKSVHGREIVDAIRAVYAGESVLHPSIARKVIQRAILSSVSPTNAGSNLELTNREREVIKMAARGMTNKQIADSLCLSIRTVQGHINGIFHKLGVGSRTEAIFQSVKRGWLSFDDIA